MHIGTYLPGSIGRIVEMHAAYYAGSWRFGALFEAQVARELGELMQRFDPLRDGFWVARDGDEVVGGVVVAGSRAPEAARLRFFIGEDGRRGAGVGEALMRAALAFCRGAGYGGVF